MKTSAAAFLPEKRNITALREAARGCRGCELRKVARADLISDLAAVWAALKRAER
jgi:hypothetical protein